MHTVNTYFLLSALNLLAASLSSKVLMKGEKCIHLLSTYLFKKQPLSFSLSHTQTGEERERERMGRVVIVNSKSANVLAFFHGVDNPTL